MVRFRVRVIITLLPYSKYRKIDLGGLGSVTSKLGKSGSNPWRKYYWVDMTTLILTPP